MSDSKNGKYAIGVDYGTNSVRAVVVDVTNGDEIASSVYGYASGTDGILLDEKDPNLARQNPADYIFGFFDVMENALSAADRVAGFSRIAVVGIGVDTTGSTPIPVDRDGMPLAYQDRFKDNLAAQAWLWKDHTSYAEAAEITELAKSMGTPYLAKCGGTYSSEWFWSKILHCQRTAPEVFEAAYSWTECADFVPGYITGTLKPEILKRSVCAAGHKAMYHADWGGLPSEAFLTKLSPALASLRSRLYSKADAADQKAGDLTDEIADRLGLPRRTPVAVGAFDAHMGAVGVGVRPGVLAKIIGTSTCDISVAATGVPDIPGLCGIVPGSVLPGFLGLEAGQSAVGDIFNWFVSNLCPEEYSKGDAHVNLTREAEKLKPGESGLLALDWNNGNRTVLVDPLLTGMIVGTTLHTTAPEMYRALVEATAFGGLKIIKRFEEYGVKIEEVVNCGGIAEKNPFVMQILADVFNRPMKISRSAQTCALGSAIFGAVVGGVYANALEAQKTMTGVKEKIYTPIPENAAVYAELYELYLKIHDAFGTKEGSSGLHEVMKKLIAIRNRVRA
jgi:L-ribulokinase